MSLPLHSGYRLGLGRDALHEDERPRQCGCSDLERPGVFGGAIPLTSTFHGGKFDDHQSPRRVTLTFDYLDRTAAYNVATAILGDRSLRHGAICVDQAVVENLDFRNDVRRH